MNFCSFEIFIRQIIVGLEKPSGVNDTDADNLSGKVLQRLDTYAS